MELYFKIYKYTKKDGHLALEHASDPMQGKEELKLFFNQHLDIVKNSHRYIICGYENQKCCNRSASMKLKEWLLESGLFRKNKSAEI